MKKNLDSLIASGFMLQNGVGSGAEFAITQKGLTVLHEYASIVDRATAHPTGFKSE
jgi:predicted transcriptional regulator